MSGSATTTMTTNPFQNSFHSVVNNAEEVEMYHGIVKEGIAKEQDVQAFNTMAEELQIARSKNTPEKRTGEAEAVVIKRQVGGTSDETTTEAVTVDPSDDFADEEDEDVRVHLSEEKRAAIKKIQDIEIRSMLESAELRAKKGRVLVEIERNKTRVARQKAFFSMFVCAVLQIMVDLQEAYKYIDLDENATTTQVPRVRVFTSSKVEDVLVGKSDFTPRQVQQVHKFFRKWYNTFKTNEMEFGNNLRRLMETYVREKGIQNYMSEIHKDFAGIMGRNYPFFSNVYHDMIPKVAARFRDAAENTTFVEAFFDVTPNWYFTRQHLEYVNLLHEVLGGRRDEFLWLNCTNKANEKVAIPYARKEICPSFLETYRF